MTDNNKVTDAATALGHEIEMALDELDARVAALEGQVDPSPPDPPEPDGDIDLSKYTLTFEENFDNPQIYEPEQKNDYGVMSRPWVPHYTAYANQYGSSGAIYDETGWMVDPRDPRMADYNPFSVKDSVLSITTRPRPPELSDLPLNNGAGNPCSWLGGALISMGGFAQQYGYFEINMKAPPAVPGNFPAFWLLSATNRWPTEIDIYEGFGSNGPSVIHPVLHSDPYWPSWSNADDTLGSVPGSTINVGVDLTQGFHRIGVDVQPEGLTFYFDRKRVGNMPPYNGVTNLEITDAGSNVKADGGSASGSLRVKILSTWQFKNFAATLTVSSGRITAVAVTQPGSCLLGVGPDDVLLINNTGGSLGNAVLTPVVADKDPQLALQYHTPLYMLVNFALGSFTGVPTAPATFQVDSVKAWRRNVEAPAITSGGGPSEDLVAQLKAWKLRHDTVPMTPHKSDWDVTKLSLWDALDFLFLADDSETQSSMDWKNLERHLNHHGSVSHTPLRGYNYVGGVGTYSDAGYLPTGLDGIRQDDHHLGVWLGDVVEDPTLKTVISAGYKTYLQVSRDSHEYRSCSGNAGGVMKKLAPGAGHLVFCRGWRYQHQSYHNGKLFHAGYVTTQTPEFAPVVVGALSAQYAGPNCRILAAHGGRRLMPDEVEKLHQLIGEYFAAIGVS